MISSFINQKLFVIVYQIFDFFHISNNEYSRRSFIVTKIIIKNIIIIFDRLIIENIINKNT